MPYPFTNRKRIRGWKRKLKELEALERDALDLNMERLRYAKSTCYELAISPFSNLTPRNPTGWFYRRYVESMFRVMSAWKTTLIQKKIDHYLALWLFEPRISRSLIVLGIKDKINFYRNYLRERNEGARFSQSLQNFKDKVSWSSMWDYERYDKDVDELTSQQIDKLRLHSALEEKNGSDTVFLIPRGTIWVYEDKT